MDGPLTGVHFVKAEASECLTLVWPYLDTIQMTLGLTVASSLSHTLVVGPLASQRDCEASS